MSGESGEHDIRHQAVARSHHQESGPAWKNAFRRVAIVTAGLAAIGGGVKILDQLQRPPVESFDSERKSVTYINTGEYLIIPHREGEPDLLFRRDSELSNNLATHNAFNSSDIAEVNGKKWDGISPLLMKNVPIHNEGDRYTGRGSNPIFMVELGVRSLLGEIVPTVGYIDQAKAPSGRVVQLKKGEIAEVGTDNDEKLIGVLESGEKIPNSEIGITQVVGQSVTTVVGNPK